MNPGLPAVNGGRIIAALRRLGFQEVRRSRGSHVQLAHPDGRRTTVPDHGPKVVGKGLLRKILRDAELSPKEFRRHL